MFHKSIFVFSWLILIFAAGIWACSGDEENSEDSDAEQDSGEGDIGCKNQPEFTIQTGTTWQWQLTEAIDTSLDVEMYDVDLFTTSKSIIDLLHQNDKIVICYFSAGSYENWRDDATDFPEAVLGNTLEGWEDEQWLDIRADALKPVMQARLDYAASRECDGVEPDNMDGYLNASGFDLNEDDQLEYNAFIAEEAQSRGLSVGLKNDVDQLQELEPCFDWALNEECFAYNECGKYAPFISAGKAVFHTEYVDDIADGQALADDVCGDIAVEGFSTLIKDWDLTSWLIACD